jgi:hypothetical protein
MAVPNIEFVANHYTAIWSVDLAATPSHRRDALRYEVQLNLRLQIDESQVITSNVAGLDPLLIAWQHISPLVDPSTPCED